MQSSSGRARQRRPTTSDGSHASSCWSSQSQSFKNIWLSRHERGAGSPAGARDSAPCAPSGPVSGSSGEQDGVDRGLGDLRPGRPADDDGLAVVRGGGHGPRAVAHARARRAPGTARMPRHVAHTRPDKFTETGYRWGFSRAAGHGRRDDRRAAAGARGVQADALGPPPAPAGTTPNRDHRGQHLARGRGRGRAARGHAAGARGGCASTCGARPSARPSRTTCRTRSCASAGCGRASTSSTRRSASCGRAWSTRRSRARSTSSGGCRSSCASTSCARSTCSTSSTRAATAASTRRSSCARARRCTCRARTRTRRSSSSSSTRAATASSARTSSRARSACTAASSGRTSRSSSTSRR